MDKCLLCLETDLEFELNIKVDSIQWEEFNIECIIGKHLWPINNIESYKWMCHICWKELLNFHKFYTRLENAHAGLLKVNSENVKLETSHNESPLLTEQAEQIFSKTKEINKEPLFEDRLETDILMNPSMPTYQN
uniref:ZAD domain-containing protein n=1 Tax=Glossina brevipalpis TaxID=37001 RepID=A0A1A9WK11_9MUSC